VGDYFAFSIAAVAAESYTLRRPMGARIARIEGNHCAQGFSAEEPGVHRLSQRARQFKRCAQAAGVG